MSNLVEIEIANEGCLWKSLEKRNAPEKHVEMAEENGEFATSHIQVMSLKDRRHRKKCRKTSRREGLDKNLRRRKEEPARIEELTKHHHSKCACRRIQNH